MTALATRDAFDVRRDLCSTSAATSGGDGPTTSRYGAATNERAGRIRMRERPIVRRGVVAVTTVATMLLGVAQAPAASANDASARKLLGIINATREKHDLRPLRLETSLNAPARRHSAKMIRANRLFDPANLQQMLSTYDWNHIGADVVGCGTSLRQMHRILMTEDFHRTILLHPKIRRVGIGIVINRDRNRCGRGSVWATEILYG
jgi:cysteine-rich secretory family protein